MNTKKLIVRFGTSALEKFSAAHFPFTAEAKLLSNNTHHDKYLVEFQTLLRGNKYIKRKSEEKRNRQLLFYLFLSTFMYREGNKPLFPAATYRYYINVYLYFVFCVVINS